MVSWLNAEEIDGLEQPEIMADMLEKAVEKVR